MGCYKQSPTLIVIAIVAALLLSTPLAYGQTSVNVQGRLCCTSNGNCLLGSSGVEGAAVNLNCTNPSNGGQTVNVGTTNNAGQFFIPSNITITLVAPTLIPLTIPCNASVNLPLRSTNCPLLNTATGTLMGMVGPVSTGGFLLGAPLPNITVPIKFTGNLDLNPPN